MRTPALEGIVSPSGRLGGIAAKASPWLLFALTAVLVPIIGPSTYVFYVASMAGVYIILASGLNIVWGYCGQIALAPAAFFGVGAYTAAVLTTRYGVDPLISAAPAVLLSVLIGIIVGLPSVRSGQFYLALITFGLAEVIQALFVNLSGITGGPGGISGIPSFGVVGYEFSHVGLYGMIAAVALGVTAGVALLTQSRLGLSFQAVRDNPETAAATGIDVNRTKIVAFAISAGVCGLAGVFYAFLAGYISPESFGFAATTHVMTMMLVGGLGTVFGPVVGAAGMLLIDEQLRPLEAYRSLIYGLIIWGSVMLFPGGLAGIVESVRSVFTKRVKQ